MRKRLDLFANIRPARIVARIPPRTGEPLDMVITRENTEGFHSDRNLFAGPGAIMPTEDIAMSFRKITRHASTRIAKVSFAEAARRKTAGAGPGKVTAVHKANVLRLSDGLFLDCTPAVAWSYPDIEYEDILIDAMCAHLVRRPSEFNVLCTTNMYGDILSDLATELAGSIGPCDGSGAAWVCPRHRRKGFGQSDVPDRIDGNAAGMDGGQERSSRPWHIGPRDDRRIGGSAERSRNAHPRSGRLAWHTSLWGSGG